jgi:hypothetical protein
MFLVHIAADKWPQPGEPIYLANNKEGQIGEIVTAQPTPEGGYDSLAVLQLNKLEKGNIVLSGGVAPKLTFCELPYELPVE